MHFWLRQQWNPVTEKAVIRRTDGRIWLPEWMPSLPFQITGRKPSAALTRVCCDCETEEQSKTQTIHSHCQMLIEKNKVCQIEFDTLESRVVSQFLIKQEWTCPPKGYSSEETMPGKLQRLYLGIFLKALCRTQGACRLILFSGSNSSLPSCLASQRRCMLLHDNFRPWPLPESELN